MENYRRSLRKIRAHLQAAKAYAELSHAQRQKVGAVIVRDDRIVSIGYNGTPSGANNYCEWMVEKNNQSNRISLNRIKKNHQLQELINKGGYELVTKPEVVHAEANAILFAARNGIKTEGCVIVQTISPCYDCSKMIIQSGIKAVWYEEEYRDNSSIGFLKQSNILVNKIKVENE